MLQIESWHTKQMSPAETLLALQTTHPLNHVPSNHTHCHELLDYYEGKNNENLVYASEPQQYKMSV